ncbi:hypothetical protein [Lacrimispora celerecrescens]|uniref:Uncharacterized protein n=1 Tax=Lacrimispora celerecrescens TaxID=29354 RepID=A0A084JJZ6_9FIRM|nr:hypothetical protein [Lacrimispora celerecrescens]KEZ89280.1 hypothetical protein IO98_14940 [Lacrimispora celerecrescens]
MNDFLNLKNLLDKNNIKNRVEEISIYEDDELTKFLFFNFPIARESEEIRIRENDPNISSIINSNFMKFRGISNYEAIWSNELNYIECEIVMPRNNVPSRFILRRLSKLFNSDEYLELESGHEISDPLSLMLYSDARIKVSVGYSSKEFAILSTYKDGRHIDIEKDITRFRPTLKIEEVSVKTQDEAKKLLEKVSNSLFYQLDILYDLVITLCPRKESRVARTKRVRKSNSTEVDIQDIKLDYEYDEIPMALYWFAQSNSDSPIFKYFALYQALEYYYPIYTTATAKTRIQSLIKDPKFNINKDSDVVQLLSIIKINSMSNISDEREQLSITLRNIVSGDEIIDFIANNENLNDYYTNKSAKKISDQKLRLTDKIGIVDDVAERIYEIRCRIVHNKASEINNKILPMTKNVDYLVNEVALLEFIARKAIIANSCPFTLV